MSEQPPQIEFPCEYPIAIVGEAAADFLALVEEIVERHAPGFERARTTLQPSRGGRYVSVRVVITATGVAQLQALFAELKGTGRVHTVL
jgi:putative lipoic acid-binding regulatory protein